MKWPEQAVREQLLVRKVWFTTGSLQGSLAKKLNNHKKNSYQLHFSFCSSSQQLSAYVCLEEVARPVDRGHCAGSPEGKGKQEEKKAILHQMHDAESEYKLGSQADISGEAISWRMSLSEALVREGAISWSSEWMSWLRKLSVLTAIRAEQWCQDSTIWDTVRPYLSKLRELLLWITANQTKHRTPTWVCACYTNSQEEVFTLVCSLREIRRNATGQTLFKLF